MFSRFVAVAGNLVLVCGISFLGSPHAVGDQACNSEVNDGDLPDNTSSFGAGGSIADAKNEAMVAALPDCALCDPEFSEDRCPKESGSVTTGTGVSFGCIPIFVPFGHPPIYVCEFWSGTGSKYDQVCGDC